MIIVVSKFNFANIITSSSSKMAAGIKKHPMVTRIVITSMVSSKEIEIIIMIIS